VFNLHVFWCGCSGKSPGLPHRLAFPFFFLLPKAKIVATCVGTEEILSFPPFPSFEHSPSIALLLRCGYRHYIQANPLCSLVLATPPPPPAPPLVGDDFFTRRKDIGSGLPGSAAGGPCTLSLDSTLLQIFYPLSCRFSDMWFLRGVRRTKASVPPPWCSSSSPSLVHLGKSVPLPSHYSSSTPLTPNFMKKTTTPPPFWFFCFSWSTAQFFLPSFFRYSQFQ